MRVLMVASEAFGLIKTGGLADVVGALPAALRDHGVTASLLIPAYRGLAAVAQADPARAIALGDPLGCGPAHLVPFERADVGLSGWLLQCPTLFDRPGGPYLDAAGQDWPDNHLRFGLLCRAAAVLATVEGLTGTAFDVVHAHDWQAGLVGAYLDTFGGARPATVFTAHNLHYGGRFDPAVLSELALPTSAYAVDGLECWGTLSFLKSGLFYSDAITTVSQSYAAEIQTEMGGEGLHGLLADRQASLHGLINGIDDHAWDPRRDPALASTYDADEATSGIGGKLLCKTDLQQRFGLAVDAATPVVGMVSRLAWQKGVDLVLAAVPELLAAGAALAVLGSGDAALTKRLREAAQAHPGRVAFIEGYDEAQSHRLIAGCDLLAVPSRFEPCGLTQMYAQRYGTLPVVRHTGGLADTVVDADWAPEAGTGFSFGEPTAAALNDALGRALNCYRDRPRFAAIVGRAMDLDRSWRAAAGPYADLYRELVAVGSRTV